MAYIDKLLGEDEEVLVYGRQHGIVVVFDVLKRMIVLAVLTFVLLGIQSGRVVRFIRSEELLDAIFTPDLVATVTRYVQVGCLLLMALVLVLVVVDYLRWTATIYVLTDRRVLSIFGIVNKRSFDSSLDRINDVQLDQSWLGQMLNYGDLVILTAADQGANALERIIAPLDFKRAMQDAKHDRERARERRRSAPPPPKPVVRDDQSISQAIHTLMQLRDQNLLTAEEFEAKKRELLQRL